MKLKVREENGEEAREIELPGPDYRIGQIVFIHEPQPFFQPKYPFQEIIEDPPVVKHRRFVIIGLL